MGSQKDLSDYERQLVALGRALQSLREQDTLGGLAQAALDYLRSEFQYALIWIGLYHQVGHTIQGCAGLMPSAAAAPFIQQKLDLQPGDLLEQVVIQQRPVGVPDLREETRAGQWRTIAQQHNIQGTVIFPIRHRDRCLGVTILGSHLWGVSPQSEEKARLSMVLGELALAVHHLEAEQIRQQVKRPAEPLFHLLNHLRSLPTLQERLDAVVEATHQFIGLDRTNIYWFEPQRYEFWQRASRPDRGVISRDMRAIAPIPVEDVSAFYQALMADQTIAIGEANGTLKADLTGRLMQRIQARSLLATPILFQNQLLGFLSVESQKAHIWTEQEKSYLQAAAQIAAITAPLETLETTLEQVKNDQLLTAELTRAIYSEDDWTTTLHDAAEQIAQRLKTQWFLVLLYNPDQEKFEVCYQHQAPHCPSLPAFLERLNQVDWQMLERSTEAVSIENLSDDLKLMAWREVLLTAGVQSVLVCNTAVDNPLEGVVMVGNESTRTWGRDERELMRVVSRQVGLILHQWQLQRQTEQQQKAYQTIQWGLAAMQQIHDLDQLEEAAMQQMANVLQVPLAALITWLPGRKEAQISAAAVGNNHYVLNADKKIKIHTDLLVQWALKSDSVVSISSNEFSVETRQWLSGSEIGQVLVMALRTSPDHEPTGVALVADCFDRYWLERQLDAFSSLVGQLAWSRRYLLLTKTLNNQREALERLNWYKQRRIEEIYRTLGVGIKRLNDLSHQKDALASMRYHQILRQLGNTLSSMVPVLKYEQWQLRTEVETTPLPTLLRRALERVDHLIKQRQLWSQVHNEETLTVGGDIGKIEFVLHEILLFACRRSPNSGRLDIWCRPLDAQWLELSITDNGVIEPRLVEELHIGRSQDLLMPSTLDYPPGLHLAICQSLMETVGGEFTLFKLEDERVLSRLIIPIVPS
ncbi:MAG: GAF domain-containing protein [Synechococcales cyanobacterium K44_A2020_017]|nr:GAF domain-containing protein [Synechococcales cyanobacterium K32_A2020_035]MBF2095448.1 GAF domain-containing protein [Synechococcales cyanobacterium K44_A2020_017]